MKRLSVMLFAVVLSMGEFRPGKDVADIAIGSADHTTLVAALKAADLGHHLYVLIYKYTHTMQSYGNVVRQRCEPGGDYLVVKTTNSYPLVSNQANKKLNFEFQ